MSSALLDRGVGRGSRRMTSLSHLVGSSLALDLIEAGVLDVTAVHELGPDGCVARLEHAGLPDPAAARHALTVALQGRSSSSAGRT